MKTKNIAILVLASSLTFVGISSATASDPQSKDKMGCKNQTSEMHHGKQHGKMKHKGMDFSQLDLSDDQKQQMREIRKVTKEQHKGKNKENRAEHQAEMLALMSEDSFNEDRAKVLINEQLSKSSEKRLSMLKAKHEMYQLLTDEQKQQYSELKKEHHKR